MTRKDIVAGAALVAAWLALWGAGLVGEYTTHASIWFPPSALTFAALVVMGWRAVPFVVLALVLSTFWSIELYDLDLGPGRGFVAGLVFSIAHIGGYGLAAVALQRLGRKAHNRLPLVIIDFLLVAVLGSLVAGTAGVFALCWTGMLPEAAVSETWLPLWVGDMVAVIVLAPLLGALLMRAVPSPVFGIEPMESVAYSFGGRPFLVKLAFNVGFITAAMLLIRSLETLESAFLVFFLVVPQMWLTYSESPFRTAVSVALNSVVIIVWMHALDLGEFVYIFQFAIAMVATAAYVGIAMPLLVADNTALRQRVMFDSLTGAASRDFLVRQVAMEIERSERNASTLCLMVIDLDHFKRINDRFGHSVGDRVLGAVFETARASLRAGDVLARFGGDEFVALLPDTNLDIAGDVAERLRVAIDGIEVAESHALTTSIGLSELVAGDDFGSLFERADLALYDAKHSGRDSVGVRRGWTS